MQLYKQYELGTVLFTEPDEKGTGQTLPGVPWPVQLWYDPPQRA